MPRLEWDKVNEKFYETGVSNGVVYPVNPAATSQETTYPKGYAWNGLTKVSENPSGGDETKLYANNNKYLSLRANEEFGGTIEAYTYPPEFEACDGTLEPVAGVRVHQQTRQPFGLCYKTLKGNDGKGTDFGFKLHLVYNATCSPSGKEYNTTNESPDAITFSWEFSTTPVEVTGYKNTSILTIDSDEVDEDTLNGLLDILYGTNPTTGDDPQPGTDPRLPMPNEIIAMFTPDSSTP